MNDQDRGAGRSRRAVPVVIVVGAVVLVLVLVNLSHPGYRPPGTTSSEHDTELFLGAAALLGVLVVPGAIWFWWRLRRTTPAAPEEHTPVEPPESS